MKRRNFVTGTLTTAAAAALALTANPDLVTAQAVTFSDDDTLTQRTQKLNRLLNADFEVDVKYPKEWETQRCFIRRDELLGAQFPRLLWDIKHPFEWSVHLNQNGKQYTHDMNPLEFFHWTSQMAWEHRRRNR